jgi:hypothetical protein
VDSQRHAPAAVPPGQRLCTRYPFLQQAGCAPGPMWTGAENVAPTGIRSPDRPARSDSVYWLRCDGDDDDDDDDDDDTHAFKFGK